MDQVIAKNRLVWLVLIAMAIPALILSNFFGGFTLVLSIVLVVVGAMGLLNGIIELIKKKYSSGVLSVVLGVILIGFALFF